MGEGGAQPAAIEVDHTPLLVAGKNHSPVEGVVALRVNQADAPQQIEGTALRGEMTPQISAGSITHVQFLQERGIVYSSLLEITEGFRVMRPLAVIESRRLLQHDARLRRSLVLFEIGEALVKGQVLG